MEDIKIVSPSPQENVKEVPEERHHSALYGMIAVALLIIVTAVFFGYRYFLEPKTTFNIPTDTSHVILFDQNALYAFEPVSGELKNLGKFKSEINVTNAAISSDLETIILASDNEIQAFSSFKDVISNVSHSEKIYNIAVSDDEIFFTAGELDERNERTLYRVEEDQAQQFALGSTPFFIGDGTKLVAGSFDGFRTFDLEVGDFLETETPAVPVASLVQPSLSGDKVVLISTAEGVHTYTTLSKRPFNLFEDFFLTVSGVFDAAVNNEGIVAYLREVDGVIYLSIFSPQTNESSSIELPVSANAQLLQWSI